MTTQITTAFVNQFSDNVQMLSQQLQSKLSDKVRTATVIKEDGVELNRSFHRHIVPCVTSVQNADDSWTHTDTDISGESTEVQAIANAVWTTAAKNAKKAVNEASVPQ